MKKTIVGTIYGFCAGLALTLLAFAIAMVMASASAAVFTNVTLAWEYPTNELSTNISFNLYYSTNILQPLTNWVILTNVSGLKTNVIVPIKPGVHFYALTASNDFGESDFTTPLRAQVARSGVLSIKPGP